MLIGCRYLLDNPHIVNGKHILDVGSGCGASAIAAAMCGAKAVLANDVDKGSGIASIFHSWVKGFGAGFGYRIWLQKQNNEMGVARECV